MRIITLNVNGIRSAERRGFLRWMAKQDADVVCLQETKAQREDLGPSVVAPHGYHSFFHLSDKKGYSGVALYTRKAPRRVVYGLDWDDFDREGRYLQADFADYSVVSLYIPSGSSSEARQQAKFAFLDRFLPVLAGLRQGGREYLLCGDWNIAHRSIDLKNWRANQNSGFLPEERAWLDLVFDEIGWVRQRGAGAIHLVVQSRPGLDQERRMAYRLPNGDAGLGGHHTKCPDLQGSALFRPCPAHHGLRSVTGADASGNDAPLTTHAEILGENRKATVPQPIVRMNDPFATSEASGRRRLLTKRGVRPAVRPSHLA